MKYLDYPSLNLLSTALSTSPAPETKVNVRFEAYSVKPIGRERKMFREMEEAYMSGQEEMEEMSFSPEMKEAGLSSCFGRLDEKESRKVHFLLVSTLNAAFPDHDFSSLRPDHFTREPNAAVVFGHLSGNLSGQGSYPLGPPTGSPLLHPLSSSPSSRAHFPFKADELRVLSEVIDLETCEVYSWFPSPEYDPHVEAEDGELSDDGYEYEEELLDESMERNMDMDMDIDENETEASWGQAGMELEDVGVQPMRGGGAMETRYRSRKKKSLTGMEAPPMMPQRSSDEELGSSRRRGGLLWSTNYFFYSKRQKRVLFLTCWCRKRSPFLLSPNPTESAFPAPISASSYTPPSHASMMAHRQRFRQRPRPVTRPLKKQASASKLLPSSGGAGVAGRDASEVDISSLIPIRGMEAPRSTPAPSHRLASSAPSATSPGFFTSPSSHAALAKMSAGGFKPRTPARMVIQAAKLSNVSPNIHSALGPHMSDTLQAAKKVDPPRVATHSTAADSAGLDGDRTRKQRSESTTSPGPSLLRAGLGTAPAVSETKGKRAKVGPAQ